MGAALSALRPPLRTCSKKMVRTEKKKKGKDTAPIRCDGVYVNVTQLAFASSARAQRHVTAPRCLG